MFPATTIVQVIFSPIQITKKHTIKKIPFLLVRTSIINANKKGHRCDGPVAILIIPSEFLFPTNVCKCISSSGFENAILCYRPSHGGHRVDHEFKIFLRIL